MNAEVTFRFARPDDIPELLELFSRAFPGRSISDSYYRWQFLENSACPFSSVVAEENGVIVSHVGYSGRKAVINGKEALVFLKATSMSDPAVRGRGIYSRLLSWGNAAVGRRGGRMVLSFPNQQNHPIQAMRPDYRDIGQIPTLVRPCRRPCGATRTAGHLELPLGRRLQSAHECEKLALATLRGCKFGLLRTAEYLTWRYVLRPDVEYFTFEDRHGGILKSALIWKYYPSEKPERIMVVEWLSDPEDREAAHVFEAVESIADSLGMPVYTWQNVHSPLRHKLLERRGYVLQTPVLYFGAFPLVEPRCLGDFSDCRLWHVAMGDDDIF